MVQKNIVSKEISKGITILPAIDWERKVFDSLIPLPDGTSYNSYIVRGSSAVAMIDSADPTFGDALKEALMKLKAEGLKKIDYVISNHAEQDHSGSIPLVLELFPEAKVVCTPKCKEMLIDLLEINPERFKTVSDNEVIDLGGRSLEFMHMPWVHWPETMVTYLREEKILFSCDFFGSHLATEVLYSKPDSRTTEAAKRYYAEIMMPFRLLITKHLERLSKVPIDVIAPSHGPLYDNPKLIMDEYRMWAGENPKNLAVIAYVSMHGSTKLMVDALAKKLEEKGVAVHEFDLSNADLGKLAISLVDAATIVVATPTVHAGPHPYAAFGTMLANALRPKAKYVALMGSYGWAEKPTIEKLSGMIPGLKVEVLGAVFCKGLPRQKDYDAITALSESIWQKHKELSS